MRMIIYCYFVFFPRFKQREDRRQRYIAEAGGGKGREDFGLPGEDQFKKGFFQLILYRRGSDVVLGGEAIFYVTAGGTVRHSAVPGIVGYGVPCT